MVTRSSLDVYLNPDVQGNTHLKEAVAWRPGCWLGCWIFTADRNPMERHFEDLGVGEPADAVKLYQGVVNDAIAYVGKYRDDEVRNGRAGNVIP